MPAWLAPAIMAGAATVNTLLTNRRNKKAVEEQNKYNEPKNQMARFQEAGLNPNLMYQQGNPGNQSQPQQVQDFSKVLDAVPLYNQTRMTDSQVQANEANTIKKLSDVEINNLQKQVLEKNPLLNDGYFNSVIDSMRSAAQLKAADARIRGNVSAWMDTQRKNEDGTWASFNGMRKMDAELALIEQRFNLGTQDQSIKAEVLKSKDFQNAILEVQKKFMTDAEITPQHILTFVQLLLMKLL